MPDRIGPRTRYSLDHRPRSARSRAVEEARCGGRAGIADMKVDGRHMRSIWLEPDGWSVGAIDQRRLPHDFVVERITSRDAAAEAIRSMLVRGAPLIGATAAYGVALAMRMDGSDASLDQACNMLTATRPTAINLKWALDEMRAALSPLPPSARAEAAYARAGEIAEQDVAINGDIGQHGLALIEAIKATKKPGEPVNVLTHCNAGWLATVDWGTATAPIYSAHDRGLGVHVWVDETRPRNQGASLTAWELGHHGVPHTVIPDNTGGHLMQRGMVDLVADIAVGGHPVGSDDDQIDHATPHQMAPGIVRNDRVGHTVMAEFPGGERGALIPGPGLVDPNVNAQTTIMRRVDRGGGGSPVHRRQPTGVAMRQYVDRFARLLGRPDRLDQRQAVLTDVLVDRHILFRDFAGAGIGRLSARRRRQRGKRRAHLVERPFQVDRRRPRRDQHAASLIEAGIRAVHPHRQGHAIRGRGSN